MQSIIWDWNGTLLNDLDFCISTINKVLKKRKLNLVTHESYKAVFSFPVKDYYETIGFDFSKEDFAIPAHEFIDIYNEGVKNCTLHNSVHEVLSYFKEKGIRQFVLSAMQQNMLNETLKHQGIFDYFEGVAGLNDHYATSKIERGEQLISQFNINKEKATIIGDTIHDYEVAEQLGTDCILIADGHQSEERLQSTGVQVISELNDLMKLPL
uniref:HAD family hydrolase n=1 Tax=uncultured Draconibacterium sp. TaxID=1573823 RepID=UPI0032178D80